MNMFVIEINLKLIKHNYKVFIDMNKYSNNEIQIFQYIYIKY